MGELCLAMLTVLALAIIVALALRSLRVSRPVHVQLMIKHHQGAVTTAKTEQAVGQDAASIALAKKIETDQNREIATMQQLLKKLP